MHFYYMSESFVNIIIYVLHRKWLKTKYGKNPEHTTITTT